MEIILTNGGNLTLQDATPAVLGRGLPPLDSFFDSRCSRKQAEIKYDATLGKAIITTLGKNPIVVKKQGKEEQTLPNGESEILKSGDTFSLIPGSKESTFRVEIKKMEKQSSKPISSTKESNNNLESPVNNTKRKIENEIPEPEVQKTTKKSKLNNSSKDADESTIEIPNMEIEVAPSKPSKKGVQEENSTKKSNQKMKTKHTPCKFGDKCYKKGDEHANKFSHPCKYGEGCYRKDDSHFERFNHPWDFEDKEEEKEEQPIIKSSKAEVSTNKNDSDSDSVVESDMSDDERGEIEEINPPAESEEENEEGEHDDEEIIDGVKALHHMEDGKKYKVQGGSGEHEIMRKNGVYSCDCHSWLNQSMPINERTCKHITEYIGTKFDSKRLNRDPSDPVPKTNTKVKEVPNLLLAHKWEVTQDPTGWWISEKLDGVRAYWDGKKMISRLGNSFVVPQKAVAIVRSSNENQGWKDVTYKIFDAPALNKPFEERVEFLNELMKKLKHLKHIDLVEQIKCTGSEHLKKKLREVEALGGEGLMLRQPKSKYVGGRSTTLLKVKSFFDSEAKVLGYEPGKGKHKGKTGALWCEMGNGKKFSVGSGLSDKERADPPAIGSIITYRYQELTDAGIPRFPTYIGVRPDATWPPDPDTQPKPSTNPSKSKFGPKEKSSAPKEKTSAPKPKKEEEESDSEQPSKKQKKEKNSNSNSSHKEKSSKSSSKEENSLPNNGTPLGGLVLAITGTHSIVRKELIQRIQSNGGSFHNGVSKAVNLLVATEQEVMVGTNKVEKARSLDIPIVSEAFLDESIKNRRPANYKKFLL